MHNIEVIYPNCDWAASYEKPIGSTRDALRSEQRTPDPYDTYATARRPSLPCAARNPGRTPEGRTLCRLHQPIGTHRPRRDSTYVRSGSFDQ